MSVFHRSWPAMSKPGQHPVSRGVEVLYGCEDECCDATPVTAEGYNPDVNPKLCPVHRGRGVRKHMNRPVGA